MTIDILSARRDRSLLGGLRHHRDPATHARWDAFLAATYGLTMTEAQVALFTQHTGRSVPRPGGYPVAVAITGRQSGKTATAADIVTFEAATAERDSADGTYALLVAQDQRGAMRTLFKNVTTAFDQVPMLRREVVGRTADTLTLDNGVSIAAYPCRPAAIRGLRARVAVCDELAFFRSTENIPVDTEMLRALYPTLATTGGRLIVLSSPYGQSGALWNLHRAHYGREESSTLVWCASASDMNPTLPADYLERMREDDPEAYRSEVLGEFRAGLATFIDADVLEACVADRRDLPSVANVQYVGFCDPSGGARDAWAVAVAHREVERTVVDCVRAWAPPFSPSSVAAESAALLRTYRIGQVWGDRYAGQFPRELYAEQGIKYRVCELDRSQLYLELLPKLNATAVELPNEPALLRELRGLERRRGFAGKDRVDHRSGSGAHDDRANACAGAVVMAARHALDGLVVMPLTVRRPSPWRLESDEEDPTVTVTTGWPGAWRASRWS